MKRPLRLLINGITLEEGNIVPLLLKVRYWQNIKNVEITFIGNLILRERINELGLVNNFHFIEIKRTKEIKTKFQFIFEGLKRNIGMMRQINKIKSRYDIIYSISSVLDLIIFPWILKKKDKKIKWVTVFDNIVPITDPGNKFIRFLAWVFFRISIILIKNADVVIVITPELMDFLKKRGFEKRNLVATGVAVESDLIKKAEKDKRFNIDALFVGRINETKGIYDMLKVLEIVKKKYPNFQLALMGRGDEITKTQFRNKILEMGLGKNIQLLGYKAPIEKFRILKSSKTFWFLSKSKCESFGIALLEAVCCGLPAFVYDLIPFRRIYKNSEIVVSEIGDYRSVAKKVIELFDKKDFENKKGKLLLGKYSWERIADIEINSFSNL